MKNGTRFHLCMALCIAVLASFSAFAQSSSVVKIGKQTWMSKNLDVSTFRNGEPIPQAKNKDEWKKAGESKQPSWCYYEFDENNGKKYGKLYNWFAVSDSRGLAPKGYHVPSDIEWKELVDILGGWDDAGKKMKNQTGWDSFREKKKKCSDCKDWSSEKRKNDLCNTCNNSKYLNTKSDSQDGNGDNSCGFSGLPGGYCFSFGLFNDIGEEGQWWSYDGKDITYPWYYYLSNNESRLGRLFSNDKFMGLSVRCIKD